MSVIRAFIAIDLVPDILSHLERVQADLREQVGNAAVRWVAVDNIHLTLKFMGDVSVSNLELLKSALQAEISSHPRFDISVGGIGTFPKPATPRVIWAGVEAPEALSNLQRGIEMQTERLGYERERRSFSGHLTLGRISRNARPQDVRRVVDALANYKVGFLGISPVEAVHLFRSDLHPSGAVYTRLMTVELAGQTFQ
jgi:RNA 2',3'-cyclic 3'-phosphodiesterase